jgi:hypothetical protein
MHPSLWNLLLLAAPAVTASFAILAFASASWILWLQQILASCLAFAVAAVGARLSSFARTRFGRRAAAVLLVTLVCLAAPLLSSASGPARWVSLGSLNLYMAPLVLPAFLVAVSAVIGCDRLRWLAFAAVVGASALLAIQPDASQTIALLVAVTVAIVRARSKALASGVTLALISIATAWSFSRPDPLEPVPHVEGVFRLALEHSILAGAVVIACAVVLVVGLFVRSFRGFAWLSAVASYYAVLFLCSVAGLTPAPLIGYGAGPLLGFGLMVAMSSWAGLYASPNNSLGRLEDTKSERNWRTWLRLVRS